jgi:hypothetical protein
MNEREIHTRRALEARVDTAQLRLDQERLALSYLQEKSNDRAAKRVEDNIVLMEKTIQTYREDLRKNLGI